jgi:hypothetical protein
MAMLECYFDDSGTHGGSPVVTWGGLFGTTAQWDYLDKRWRALLADPLPEAGKPPLGQFHLSHCAALDGEFANYNRAESDRVRYLFRRIIADSKVESYAYSVSTRDYDELVRGRARRYFGSAEKLAITGCLAKALVRANQRREDFVSVTFDSGRMTPEIRAHADYVQKEYEGPSVLISICSMPVASLSALQAADTIATESFWNAKARLNNGDADYSAHLLSLLREIDVIRGYIMEREHIKALLKKYRLNPNRFARFELDPE